MMKAWVLLAVLTAGGATMARADDLKWRLNTPGPAAPVDRSDSAPYQTVTGTVTVRRDGVLVDAQRVEYSFSPSDFDLSFGPLSRVAEGTFFLREVQVPMDASYTLTLTAIYDSRIRGSDGITQQAGRTYRGSLRLSVPGSRRYDFGVQFIDLK